MIERCEATMVQEQNAVGDAADTRELVSGDDRRRGIARVLANESRRVPSRLRAERVVVEHEPFGG